MDTMGHADELGDEDVAVRAPLLSPEARAVTAAGLVLAALMSQGLFQYLSFFVLGNQGSPDPATQYATFAGPMGVIAAAGAALGWQVRGLPLAPGLRGLGVAAAVVGTVITAAALIGIVVAFTGDPQRATF